MKFAIFLFLCLFANLANAQSIETIAGTGEAGYSETQINNPFGVIVGPDGDIYFCDTGNHAIRRISRKSGKLETIAGTGKAGYSGDGGSPLEAELFEPYELRFDEDGDLIWVEMQNHLIRMIDAETNTISTIAGRPEPGFSGDGGPATDAQFNRPHSIVFDSGGDILVCDIGNHRIRQIDRTSGRITTWCGNGEKKPTSDGAEVSPDTPLNGPRALAIDPSNGDLWLALREGNQIFRIKDGVLHHVAGTGKKGFTGNGGPALEATLSGPKGVALSPDGNLVYLADTESHTVRAIDLSVDLPTLQLIAGTGAKGDGPDGDPLSCAMARLHGVGVDPMDGTLYIGDSEAHKVRKLPSAEAAPPKTIGAYQKREVEMSDQSTAFIVSDGELKPGTKWLWRMRFFGAFPSVDLAMLEEGWAIGYVDIGGEFGGPRAMTRLSEFYHTATTEFGLSSRPVIEGFSRGGLPAINWSSANPEKVAGIYLDAPVMNIHSWPGRDSDLYDQALAAYDLALADAQKWKGPLDRLAPLAKAGVPIFSVCGGADEVVPYAENSEKLRSKYLEMDGNIRVFVKAGCGHHPHSLHDPELVVEWLKSLD